MRSALRYPSNLPPLIRDQFFQDYDLKIKKNGLKLTKNGRWVSMKRKIIKYTLKSRCIASASRTSYLLETKSLTCFQWSLFVPWINSAISAGSSTSKTPFFCKRARPQSGSALNWRLASSSSLKICLIITELSGFLDSDLGLIFVFYIIYVQTLCLQKTRKKNRDR